MPSRETPGGPPRRRARLADAARWPDLRWIKTPAPAAFAARKSPPDAGHRGRAQQVAPARPFADQLAYVIGAEVLWVKAG